MFIYACQQIFFVVDVGICTFLTHFIIFLPLVWTKVRFYCTREALLSRQRREEESRQRRLDVARSLEAQGFP